MTLNSLLPLKKHVDRGTVSLTTCLLILPLRTFFLFLAQGLFYLFYHLNGKKNSWALAGKWWSVWGSLADLGCLLILIKLTKREGLTLVDLFKPFSKQLVWKALLNLLIVLPFSAVGSVLGSLIIYGSWHADLTPGVLYDRHLPVWGIVYSFIIWIPIWSATEEMTYNGYLATRIDSLKNQKWLTISVVCFWWAIQHSFLPFIPNWRYFAWRFISFIPCVLALVIIYMRTRNLSALVVAHLILDLGAVTATISYQ